MDQPLVSILSDISGKLSELAASQDSMKAKIRSLEVENGNLKEELSDTRSQLQQALLDVEFLKMSHRLADSPDSLIATRRRIARLIRTIDNCISMLKEE